MLSPKLKNRVRSLFSIFVNETTRRRKEKLNQRETQTKYAILRQKLAAHYPRSKVLDSIIKSSSSFRCNDHTFVYIYASQNGKFGGHN